jgi:hypothetical protein
MTFLWVTALVIAETRRGTAYYFTILTVAITAIKPVPTFTEKPVYAVYYFEKEIPYSP